MGSSATIQFACSACEHVLEVPKAFAGKRGKCTSCKQVVRVPGASSRKKVVTAPAPAGAEHPEAPSPVSSLITGFVCGGVGVLMASLLT